MAQALKDIIKKKKEEPKEEEVKPVETAPTPEEEIKPEEKPSQPVVAIGENTKGMVTLPNGKTYIGLSQAEINEVITGYNEQKNIPSGAVGTTGAISQEQYNLQKQQKRIEEERILKKSKDIAAARGLDLTPADLSLQGIFTRKTGLSEKQRIMQSARILDTAEKTNIEKEVYDEGVTLRQKFASFVEGLPNIRTQTGVIGFNSLINKLTGDTPAEEIVTLQGEIDELMKMAKFYYELGLTGEFNPIEAQAQIDEINMDIQRLESKIRLLINYSPILKSSPQQIEELQKIMINKKLELAGYRLR
jgi:hypothetical protein